MLIYSGTSFNLTVFFQFNIFQNTVCTHCSSEQGKELPNKRLRSKWSIYHTTKSRKRLHRRYVRYEQRLPAQLEGLSIERMKSVKPEINVVVHLTPSYNVVPLTVNCDFAVDLWLHQKNVRAARSELKCAAKLSTVLHESQFRSAVTMFYDIQFLQYILQLYYILYYINRSCRVQLHSCTISNSCSTFVVKQRTVLHKSQFRSVATLLYDLQDMRCTCS